MASDLSTAQGTIIDNNEMRVSHIDNAHRNFDVMKNLDAKGIIHNSPMIKHLETLSCSGEVWKGMYTQFLSISTKNDKIKELNYRIIKNVMYISFLLRMNAS